MKQFVAIFKKVGGAEILRQYWQSKVLLFALVETVILGFSKKSLEIVRLAVNNRILCKYRKKYKEQLLEFKKEYSQKDFTKKKPDTIWICWLQGIEAAPEIVQACYKSIRENITDRKVVLLTEDNYRDYIKLPSFIEQKHKNGIIGNAHYADLLRLEILNQYGGTWVDSTVLCTSKKIPSFMLDSELFVFQTLKPGLDGHAISMSNWFITACSHEPILEMTLKLLYHYWERENALINYYIFHIFFQMAIEVYPNEWKKVVPCSNETPHILLLNLFEKYNYHFFSGVIEQICFHKLTYKFEQEKTENKATNYAHIIEYYGGSGLCQK